MKTKLVVTPQLLQEMEATVRNSAIYKAKIQEAKEFVSKDKEFIASIFASMKVK